MSPHLFVSFFCISLDKKTRSAYFEYAEQYNTVLSKTSKRRNLIPNVYNYTFLGVH